MSQSLARVLVHVVFSTKDRAAVIRDPVRDDLHAYLVGICGRLDCPSLQIGGTADHVHALFSLARTRTIAAVVEEAKKSSSKWLKQRGVPGFSWQGGYGAFSIGESQAGKVVAYIARQEEHHRRMTFQDELRALLERYRVAYDERYVWD